MSNLFNTSNLSKDAGINTANPDTNYNGDSDPWELWAGWEGTSVAHRFLFVPPVLTDDKGGVNNWINCRLYFKTPYIEANSYFQVLTQYPSFNETLVTWNNHNPEFEFQSAYNRKVMGDGPWYYIDIPPDLWYKVNNLGRGLFLREIGYGQGFAKIYSRHHPDSNLRPQMKFWYMRNPSWLGWGTWGDYGYEVSWQILTIEDDDFWTGYRIEDSAGNQVFNGLGVLYDPRYRQTYLYNLPNGKNYTVRIRGKYYSSNAGTRYSSTSAAMIIPVAYQAQNFNVAKDGNNAILTWTKPNAYGGNNPSYYKIYHSTNGVDFSYLGYTSNLNYTHGPIGGTHYYYITAYYTITGESLPSLTKSIFINQRPSTSITYPATNQVVDPGNCSFQFTFVDSDTGDSITASELEIVATDGSYSKTKPGTTTTINVTDMPAGKTMQVRARVKDNQGSDSLWSYWTAWKNFKTNTKPIMSNYDPADGGYTDNQSPTLSVKFNDPDSCAVAGADYCQYIQLQVWDMTKASKLWDSGETQAPIEGGTGQVKNGQTASVLIGTTLDLQKTYYLKVRIKDNHGSFTNAWSDWQWLELNIYYETNAVTYTVMEPDITGLSVLKAHIGDLVTATGQYFGDIQRNSELEIQSVEAIINSWTDTSIIFYVPSLPVTGIYQPVRIENNVSGFDDEYVGLYIYDNDPILNELIPLSIGTNALLQLNGSGFGNSWYIPTAYNNPLRKIFISGSDKFDGPITIEIPVDAVDTGKNIYSWQDDRIIIYVPENASSEIYVENFHAENPDSDTKEVSIVCHEIQKLDENGDRPIWYWGETCVLYGRDFGDRQGHSKILLAGQVVPSVTAWTNNQIIFVFAGFDLSMFPHGEFPFGDNIMVSVLKYGTEGDLRCEDRCSVECWKSIEDRHVSIASSEAGIQSRGIGEDTTKGGLTIPQGGGGLMEKAIRLDGGDFAFTKAGQLEFVTRRPKLLQDLLIMILTYYGNDPYHVVYGCKHEFEIGGIYNQDWYQHNLKTELIRVMNEYINSQKTQMKLKQGYFVNQFRRTFIYDVELIKRVKDIIVDFHETEIRISLQIETLRGDLVLKTMLGRKAGI